MRAAFLLASTIFLAACSEEIAGTLPAPAPHAGSGRFQAGAAKADITPMPGVPMGGYAIIGRTGRGVWTRLHARAVYFEDAAGEPLVLVACDLWSMSAGLADRVAERVAADPDGRHIGREHIVLGASHTHHSPGNFSSSKLYNAYASPRGGFDPDLFEFLAERIAGAIVEAARRRRPATLHVGTHRVAGVARNRSFGAFALDPERDAVLEENDDLVVRPFPGRRVDAYRAVDPTVTVLRADPVEPGAGPIALAAFFAVHATAMGPQSEVYSSDLFGVATTLAEQTLGRDGAAAPVVALLNGAEGDVSPNWEEQDARNTVALGTRLAGGILAAARAAGDPVEGRIDHRFAPAIPLGGSSFAGTDGVMHHTAAEPRMGAAAVGGAEDGRTPLYDVGWREGVTGERTPTQGPKRELLNPWNFDLPGWVGGVVHWLGTPPEGPATFPAGVYRIGPVVVATLPGEFTTALGRRIAAALASVLAVPGPVLLVGLANEYVSYFTTPEEYEAQHYEGGSTLYGPASGPLVAHELVTLARVLRSAEPPPPPGARRFHYRAGPARRFGVADVGAPPYAPDAGLADVLQDPATGLPVRTRPCVVWEDGLPAWTVRTTPAVAIETRDGATWRMLAPDGVPETDQGLDFVTVALAAGDDGSRWAAHWMPPPAVAPSAALRFRIERVAGDTIRSAPFTLAGIRAGAGCLRPAEAAGETRGPS